MSILKHAIFCLNLVLIGFRHFFRKNKISLQIIIIMGDIMIKTKRAYEPSSEDDGFRILIDRLWPRGISKEKADLNLWMKDIAPSNDLRKWFSHDPEKWKEFQDKYREELKGKKDSISKIKDIEKENSTVTLVYSAKDKDHNNAIVLKDILI